MTFETVIATLSATGHVGKSSGPRTHGRGTLAIALDALEATARAARMTSNSHRVAKLPAAPLVCPVSSRSAHDRTSTVERPSDAFRQAGREVVGHLAHACRNELSVGPDEADIPGFADELI